MSTQGSCLYVGGKMEAVTGTSIADWSCGRMYFWRCVAIIHSFSTFELLCECIQVTTSDIRHNALVTLPTDRAAISTDNIAYKIYFKTKEKRNKTTFIPGANLCPITGQLRPTTPTSSSLDGTGTMRNRPATKQTFCTVKLKRYVHP